MLCYRSFALAKMFQLFLLWWLVHYLLWLLLQTTARAIWFPILATWTWLLRAWRSLALNCRGEHGI